CQLSDAGQAAATVQKLSRAPGKSLSSNAGLKTTTALLPPQSQAVLYLNVQALGLVGLFRLAEAAESPPLGFALSTIPGGVETQFVIPFGTLQAVFESIKSEPEDD